MTQQIINIGAVPNDGTGDAVRSSFDKCNLNFTELYQGVAKGVSIGAAIEYQFNNTTTEPPASGQIRFNQATQASTTKLWASHTTSSGINIKQFLSAATTGAKLILQDENDNTNYIKFDVTGIPVDKTTYWEFAVAVTASGGNLPNAAILAAVTAAAGAAGAPVGAEYITSTADATLSAERVLTDTATVTWDRTTAGQIKANATATGGVAPPQGRLTLQTATPVMITTQAAKTTIFYTPYVGNQIPIYDGTNMVMTAFAELSVATTDTTKSPAAIGASKVNDWFVWSDAGTLRIGHGPDWTSDTARSAGTALARVGGLFLNSVSITNGPAASRGTYVGTTRSNASSQLDWQFGSLGTGVAQAAFFNVWNCYNRVDVKTLVTENTSSWAYGLTTPRSANNSTGNRISFVSGLAEDCSVFSYWLQCTLPSGTCYIGLGLDSTSTWDHVAVGQASPSTSPTVTQSFGPLLGYHFVQAMEQADGSVTTTFNMIGSPSRGGLNGQLRS